MSCQASWVRRWLTRVLPGLFRHCRAGNYHWRWDRLCYCMIGMNGQTAPDTLTQQMVFTIWRTGQFQLWGAMDAFYAQADRDYWFSVPINRVTLSAGMIALTAIILFVLVR